jgi:hypothetical protein
MRDPRDPRLTPDELTAIEADIADAQAVAQTLPVGSWDRSLIDDTIARLKAALTASLQADRDLAEN